MAIIPEVYEPDDSLPPDLVALRRFAYLMDEAIPIPGTRRRVGVDAGLSLIPGVGEVVGGVLSAWIIVGALRHRVPMRRVLKMALYILLDITVGAIPILGTVFDWLFEENVMNMQSLLRYRDRSRPPRSVGDIALVAFIIHAVILAVAAVIVIAVVAGALWLIQQR